MKNAGDYHEWRDAAMEFDRLTGLDQWRHETDSPDYDHRLVAKELQELKVLRQVGDIEQLAFSLHEGLHGSLGNMANPALHSYCLVGTKTIIEDDANVKEFIIEQLKLDTFKISYVSSETLSEVKKQTIETTIERYLESGLTIVFERKISLDRSNRGKLKQFTSYL